jgi:hypothetical protein
MNSTKSNLSRSQSRISRQLPLKQLNQSDRLSTSHCLDHRTLAIKAIITALILEVDTVRVPKSLETVATFKAKLRRSLVERILSLITTTEQAKDQETVKTITQTITTTE